MIREKGLSLFLVHFRPSQMSIRLHDAQQDCGGIRRLQVKLLREGH
jgi:hypothetical protein